MGEKKPKKKKTLVDHILTVILVGAIGVFCYAGYNLFTIFMEYKAGTDEYNEIAQMAVTVRKAESGQEMEIDEEKTSIASEKVGKNDGKQWGVQSVEQTAEKTIDTENEMIYEVEHAQESNSSEKIEDDKLNDEKVLVDLVIDLLKEVAETVPEIQMANENLEEKEQQIIAEDGNQESEENKIPEELSKSQEQSNPQELSKPDNKPEKTTDTSEIIIEENAIETVIDLEESNSPSAEEILSNIQRIVGKISSITKQEKKAFSNLYPIAPVISVIIDYYNDMIFFNTNPAIYALDQLFDSFSILNSSLNAAADIRENGPSIQAPIEVDFEVLQRINDDVIGWIYMEALDTVNYPVVKGEDNDEYLHHTYEGKYNFAGTIFIDYENSRDFNDCNTLVYGHNMKNGSMFGQLKKFVSDSETYKKSKYFWLLTPEADYRYEIIAAYTTGVKSDTYTLFTGPGQKFLSYMDQIREWSVIETTSKKLTVRDKIVTLSTCTGNESTRFVVQGVRVDTIPK